MDLEEILQRLVQADVRLEIIMRSIIETLAKKTGVDGKPILTRDEVADMAEELKKKILEEAKSKVDIVKPNIIIPPNA